MTTPRLAGHPAASQQAIVDAALLMLRQMGLPPDDLIAGPEDRPPVPTCAEYVPAVSAAVTDGTRRAYGSYWNRVTGHWGERRLDEIAPSEIRQLMSYVKTHVVARRNAGGGRSATEHLVAALRCLYRHAEDDGFITPNENPDDGRRDLYHRQQRFSPRLRSPLTRGPDCLGPRTARWST